MSDEELTDLNANRGWNIEDTVAEDHPEIGQSDSEWQQCLAQRVRDFMYDSVVSSLHLDSREVRTLYLPGLDYKCLITGGMSWGDSPTDAFDDFLGASSHDGLFELLVSFAKEDFAKECAEDQHDEESQTADARIEFVADALADLHLNHTVMEVIKGAGEDNVVVCYFRHMDLEQLQDILGSCG